MKLLVKQLRANCLLGTLCAVTAVLGIGCSPATNSEPRYNGRTLSEWLMEYEAAEKIGGTRETNAITAISAIGSNAAPFLVEWINVSYKKSERILDLVGFAGGKSYTPPRLARANRAMRAFQILGTNAAQAIPGLTNIVMQYGELNEAAIDARYALVNIGAPGVAALSTLATNQSTPCRIETIQILGASGRTGGSDEAKPALTNCLSDSNSHVRYAAECALAELTREDERRAKGK